MKNIARIHSIETFGTVDGPGIRVVIFMQGCPLKCKYCHNRDTWEYSSGEEYSVDDLIKRILRSKPYMDSSNGGVTISGGEPLLQAEFLITLFTELKKLNIHTCIDTAGSMPITDTIKKLLSLTDLVLLDIKCINNDKAINLTGFSNENELLFANYLNDNNIPMWIRQVLVPGYTDDENDLKSLKEFIDSLSNVEKVELLPYHDLGKFKWIELTGSYPLENVSIPTTEEINKAKKILGL